MRRARRGAPRRARPPVAYGNGYDCSAVTVAAVILVDSVDEGLADTAGRPAVRRMVESAWAGGATPLVVIGQDRQGEMAAALAGSPALLAEPAPAAVGPIGQVVRGMTLAAQEVTDTDGALILPGRMVWVDAETVTTMIEAHGAKREAILQPTYTGQTGWPVLLPMVAVDHLSTMVGRAVLEEMVGGLAALDLTVEQVETGDPGVAYDSSTPVDQLPEFRGPPEPVAGAPEWGAAAAEMPDEAPLEGPALAPYGQAAEEGD